MSRRRRIIVLPNVTKPGLYVVTHDLHLKIFTLHDSGKFERWAAKGEAVFFLDRVSSYSIKILTRSGVGYVNYHVAQKWMKKA